jgi:hypothetical protein
MDTLTTELGKWTKSMLVDFILFKSLPIAIKLSDELSQKLNCPNDSVSPPSNSLDVAYILQSVVSELKNLSQSNLKMHDKLNRLGISGSADNVVKPKLPLIIKPMQTIQPTSDSKISAIKRSPPTESSKFIVGSGNLKPTKISAAPIRKQSDIFVSRLDPCVTNEMLKAELFPTFDNITITQLMTKHPTYASFHIQLPLQNLNEVLEPSFWPESVIVKRFWGRLQPGMALNSAPKN